MGLIRIAFTVAGTIVGAIAGGPAGAMQGFVYGSTIGSIAEGVTTNEPPVEGPRMVDSRVQSSAFGRPIPKVYGSFRIAGNVIWAAPIEEVVNVTDGDKGAPDILLYTYTGMFAIGLCAGPILEVRRIWADGKLLYDLSGGNAEVVALDGMGFRLYLGDEDQLPDEAIKQQEGVGNVPGFRGLAYIVFWGFPLGEFGNRIPSFTFEVVNDTTNIVPWSSVGDTVQSLIWGDRNVVMHPDGENAIIETAGYWYKVNMVTGEIVHHETHLRGEYHSDPIGPGTAEVGGYSLMDIDETGTIYIDRNIYGEGPFGSNIALVKVDSDTFQISYEAPGENVSNLFIDMHVVANAAYPYLYLLQTQGFLQMRYRDTLQWRGGTLPYLDIPRPVDSTGTLVYESISVDDETGNCWALASSSDSTYVVRIEPSSLVPGDLATGATITEFDITAWTGVILPGSAGICFDPDTNIVVVFVFGVGGASSLDFMGQRCLFLTIVTDAGGDTLLPVWDTLTSVDDGFEPNVYNDSHLRQGVIGGYLYYVEEYPNMKINRLDVANGLIDKSWIADDPRPTIFGSGIYHALTHSVLEPALGTGWIKILLDRFTESGVTLASIVTDLCEQVGIAASDIDVTELTDVVPGYYLGQRLQARAAIEQLATAYFFDGVETDGKLYFQKRGQSSVATITEGELAAHKATDNRPQELVTTRMPDLELPLQVEVLYSDQSANYDQSTQRARRIITDARHLATVEFPLALSHSTAAQVAQNLLATAWVGRIGHGLQVSRAYSYLNPADVITVQEGGNTHVVRIERMDFNGGVVSIGAVNEETSSYASAAEGVDVPGKGQVIPYPGITYLAIADVPLLRGTNNQPGIYMAGAGGLSTWLGADIYIGAGRFGEGKQGGTLWEPFFRITKAGVVGKAVTALAGVADPFLWDRGNTVQVVLLGYGSSLASSTEALVLNGANAAVLGSEVIQFTTATEVSTGVYELSGLLRGRKGSDFATGTHASGESFLLLDDTLVHFVPYSSDRAGETVAFRAVSVGRTFDKGMTVTSTTIDVNNMEPLSPQHIKGSRDVSDNLTITWIRRTRISGEWADSVGPPLGETAESYSIDVVSGGAVVRTITAASETASYTAAQQSTDGLTPGDDVDVIVYQISSIMGRGFASAQTTI